MKKILFPILTSVFLGLISTVQAEVQHVNVQAIGYGESRRESLLDAISTALAQHKGGSVESKMEFVTLTQESAATKRSRSNDHTVLTDAQRHKLSSLIEGEFAGFTVMSTEKLSDKDWKSEVSVEIAQYQSPLQTRRESIAILPFRVEDNYTIDNVSFKGSEVAGIFEHGLVTELTQTQRYDVVDRAFEKEYQKEIDLIVSKNAAPLEIGRFGSAIGADYLVVGTLRDLYVDETTTRGRYTGRTQSSQVGYIRAEYRLIETASRRVIWSDTTEFDVSEIAYGRNDAKSKLNTMLTTMSDSLSNQLTEAIFPLRVVDVENEFITLNQGGDSVEVGQILDLYAFGKKELRDPYTNESLGKPERYIGSIEIIRKTAKTATANMLDGNIDMVVPSETVARRLVDSESRVLSSSTPPASRQRNVEPGPNGGVRMPWQK